MDLWQQAPAEGNIGPAAREHTIERNETIQQPALRPRQFLETDVQPAFQRFKYHGHNTHISDPVAPKSLFEIFRTQGPEVNDGGAADKRADEAHHEVNRMIRWQD